MCEPPSKTECNSNTWKQPRLYLVNCGICHGEKLDGNGPLYKGGEGPFPLNPRTLVGDAKYTKQWRKERCFIPLPMVLTRWAAMLPADYGTALDGDSLYKGKTGGRRKHSAEQRLR